MAEDAHPESLISTEWVAEHGGDANMRLVEVDVDTSAYEQGHIAGAVTWNWQSQLQQNVARDIVSRGEMEALLSGSGISPDTTIVLYGDNNNWFAAWAFWQLRYYGHQDVNSDSHALVDVRSPDEFSGVLNAPPNLPQEGSQRSGHIPGTANIPWGQAVNEDGTFKSADELSELYGGRGVDGSRETIAYCRIGERSSHTWFVLSQLLGYDDVRNYDGSWTEWGSIVGAPIERDV